ncbi:hypothetical protein Sste5346_005896 [Sporothrix stenoceras]|uniref:C2H2-type domain-containing protein n=1 Tax=Sporothrix stenoceras TaxID=5173 RepID=A0ABR3Z4G8_9PEZI
MALDAPAVAYGSLPPANLAAARQHVQTLSARDREALLRALLEQYEQPSSRSRGSSLANSTTHSSTHSATHSSRSSSSTTTGSISAFMSSSLFDCPPLQEESEEDFAVFSAIDLQSASASAISPTADANPWTASIPSPTHSQRLRSQSVSLTTAFQPLRSSYSTSQLQDNHGRSKSFSSISDVPAPLQLPSSKEQPAAKTTTTTTTAISTTSSSAIKKPRSKPVLRIKTSAADFQDKEPSAVSTTKASHSYWCTACGEKLGDRTAWVLHDVACRGKERSLSRADDSRDTAASHGSHAHTLTQRAWACGFCAAFLGSLERYQSHVAGHFERGRTLGHWHFANVIYGLLHQPAIHKPWKRLWAARAAALPSHLRPKATWSPGCCLLGREAMDEPVTLQEALELFDPSKESATALALQADALAIYISVPIDEEAEKKQRKHSRTHKSDPTHTKPRVVEAAKVQEVQILAPNVATINITQRPESPPLPATSTTNLLPTPEIATALSPAPATNNSNNNSTQTKDAPLPALPSYSTLQQSSTLSLPSSSPPKDVKRGSKLSPRKPLFLFRSRSPSSSPESATEKATPTKTVPPVKETLTRQSDKKASPPTAKLSKPRRVVSTPVMSPTSNPKGNASTTSTVKTTTTAKAMVTSASRNTTTTAATSSRNNWADRPLPPLVIDDFGIISNRATATGTPIYTTTTANYANYTNYAKDQPPKPPPKPRAYTPADTMGDWNSIATTIVDDIMGPVNALHITV